MYESMTNREIDIAAATKIMEWKFNKATIEYGWDRWLTNDHRKYIAVDEWKPSEDINAAFEVVEKLREKGIHFDIFTFADFYEVCLGTDVYCANPSLPKAICIAALKSVKT
jgi:hypothetical protein